ncbi:MAG: SpoIID/LytB domain-containing protein [Ruminococcus sp.]|nr:SpoIID/LytB domain-containing protein [Ruminococcus sp.]
MKGHLQLMAVFTVFLALIPLISLFDSNPAAETVSAGGGETVLMLFSGEDTPEEIPMQDYIIGAVAAQMPADFGEEALKAQAVLAHTYALRRRSEEKLSPTEQLRGADMSDDSSIYQAYFTPEQIRSVYGSDTDEVIKKLYAAAGYAISRTLTFEGEPIIAAFHAVSCGRTRSALSAWGRDIPYLISVDSSGDADLDICHSEITLTDEQLFAMLTAAFPDAGLSEDELSVKVTELSPEGCAATVELCGSTYVTGEDLAEAAGLPSSCFEVSKGSSGYTFSCMGRGHLVGLSQYGARELAAQGSSCEDILAHYFPNAVLTCTEPVI